MALVVKDRVKQDTTTTGTGSVTLSGSYTGFDTFSEIGNANTTYYVISDSGSGDWEVGLGTYTASGTVLSRDTILASSNSGSVVNLAAGTKVVFCGYPAGKSVYLDASGNLVGIAGTVSATNITGATVTATSKIHTPAISVTNVSATNIFASTKIHTPVLSATNIIAGTVTATSIHTPSLSVTNFIAATITATSKIHTPAISVTNVSATNIFASTKIHTPVLSATNIIAGTVTATSIHTPTLSVTNFIAATITATSKIHTPAISVTNVSATNIFASTKIHTAALSATNIVAGTVTATSIHTPTLSVTNFNAATITATSNIHTPALSATNILAATITATTKIHTPALSATNITAGSVTATSIHTPSLSVTNFIAATITATSNIHTPALSATNIIAATITATTKIHTVALSATTVSATSVYATNFIKGGTALAGPGRVLLVDNDWSTGTPSAVTFEDADGMDWSTYSYFDIELAGYISTSCRILCQMSQGGAYEVGGTDYHYANTGQVFTAGFSNGTSAINIPNVSNQIYKGGAQYNEMFHLKASLYHGLSDGTNINGPWIHWSFVSNVAAGGNRGHANGTGALRNLVATVIDGIRFQLSSGTMNNGSFKVWGIV